MGELADAQPTGEQHFDDGAVALAFGTREVDAGNELIDLFGREHFGQMFAQPRRFEQFRGVVVDVAVELKPAVERAHAAQDAGLRGGADAQFVERGSEVLQVFQPQLQGVMLLLVAVAQQVAQVVAIGRQRVLRVVALQLQIAHVLANDVLFVLSVRLLHNTCKDTTFS